ncbi:calcium-dependent protein kinase family protein [Striga asiatica]|uniref:Calcium-dependent protein kinase family protein n=1 Tax=Striga asiatica TaxID=4170 RepID=A0A5A7PPR0_STRAF|nr:calcium-dependent protein kinase family protein [Striga asiatica]
MCEALNRDYQLCQELGRGRFGVVHRCYSADGEPFACKSIRKASLSPDPADRRCLETEPKILHLLSGCPNILRLHAAYEDDEYVHIVTDLCDGGDLFDRISSGAPFREPDAAAVLWQLMTAIAFCHRMGVAHRDIKPDNILFDSRGRLRLADFGSAEFFRDSGMSGVVGTPYYVAPEVLSGREYGEKVDVWSAGVILYIMLAGVPPFYGDGPAETFEAVLRGNLRFPTKIFRSVSAEAKDLLRKMICRDVSRRLSAEQVLRHPWIVNGGDTSPLEN